MKSREAYKRLKAAHALLLEPSSTRKKFNAARALIRGFRPELDTLLDECERELSTVDKILDGNFAELAAERLPETTEEEKKRKKTALLFIQNWNKLKSEVSRVEAELAAAQHSHSSTEKQSHWGNILKHLAGPLGLITVVAVGIALLNTTSVKITIENKGCGTMEVSSSIPISLPGFSLPEGPIKNGGSATATLPPLTVSVDGVWKSALLLKALKFSMTFELPSNIKAVTIDGVSLLGKKSEVHLGDAKDHTLVLSCAP